MPRVFRYPRNNKHKASEVESPIETEGVTQWEDIRCVICMEPPHKAVLLHCSSYSKGCRPYMCGTNARHSNCFKQYCRNTRNCFNSKILKCPLCRGEVNETLKVTSARRFMNAKARSCSIDGCEFSGTYSQLKKHSKTEHPRCIQPKVDPLKRRMWEQMERDVEHTEVMNAIGIPNRPEVVHRQLMYNHHHSMVQLSFDRMVQNNFGSSQVGSGLGIPNYAAYFIRRLVIRETTMFHD